MIEDKPKKADEDKPLFTVNSGCVPKLVQTGAFNGMAVGGNGKKHYAYMLIHPHICHGARAYKYT